MLPDRPTRRAELKGEGSVTELIAYLCVNDLDRPQRERIAQIARYRATQIHLYGDSYWLNAWRRDLDDAGMNYSAHDNGGRHVGAEALLSAHVAEHYARKAPPEATWAVIGKRPGLYSVVEFLRDRGARADWYPTVTPEAVTALCFDNPQVITERLRELTIGYIKRQGGEPTHIGQVSQHVFTELPELQSRDRREQVFGVQGFRRICEQVGIPVQGKEVALPPGT